MANQPYTDDLPPYSDELSDEITNYSDALLLESDTVDQDDGDSAPLSAIKPSRRRRPGSLKIILIFIGCAFVTVVMAFNFTWKRSRRASSKSPNRVSTHKPNGQNKNKDAIAYQLDFPALYPEISSKAGSECRAAWDTLTSVPCHDKVFDRTSDNGTSFPLRWDPMYFLPKMCTSRCKDALEDAYSALSAKCSSNDSFILDGYDGRFGTNWLEAGPTASVEKLLQRSEHLCRSSPTGDSDYQFCPIEMLQRFAITDGVKASLDGIASMVEYTRERKVEQAQWHRGSRGSRRYRYSYNYKTRQQLYGPNDGETSCGWCTFDYLNRTINSWTEGAVSSPDSHQPVSLPEFINRVEIAGRRCAPSAKWDKIYQEAVARYVDTGLLPADWKTTLPSGDMHYLINNGPSASDSPVSDIYAEVQRLSSPEVEGDWNQSTKMLHNSKACLENLVEIYTSANCYINLSPDELTDMMNKESKPLRASFCSQECSDVVNHRLANPKSGIKCRAGYRTPEATQFYEDYAAATKQRNSYCALLGTKSYSWDCAKALQTMNTPDWAFNGRPNTPIFLAAVEKGLEELKDSLIPGEWREAFEKDPEVLASSPTSSKLMDRKWMEQVGGSVCAGCVWNWLAGKTLTERTRWMSPVSSTSEYVDTVKKYHSTCTALGATWLGGVPYGDDPVIWRVKDSRGRVMRYIEKEHRTFHGGEVWGVEEATGAVSIYSDEHGSRPGADIGSIWHVLEAERALKATKERRFEEWRQEEKQHRKEADDEIWDVSQKWSGPRYIGPKGGFGEKTQAP